MTQSLKDTIQEINSRYAAALSQPGAPGLRPDRITSIPETRTLSLII